MTAQIKSSKAFFRIYATSFRLKPWEEKRS